MATIGPRTILEPFDEMSREAERYIASLADATTFGDPGARHAVLALVRGALEQETRDIKRLLRPSLPDRPVVLGLLARFDDEVARVQAALDALRRTRPDAPEWRALVGAARRAIVDYFAGAHMDLSARIERRHGSRWIGLVRQRVEMLAGGASVLEPRRAA